MRGLFVLLEVSNDQLKKMTDDHLLPGFALRPKIAAKTYLRCMFTPPTRIKNIH